MGLCVTRICGPRRVATRVAYPKRMVSDKKHSEFPQIRFHQTIISDMNWLFFRQKEVSWKEKCIFASFD